MKSRGAPETPLALPAGESLSRPLLAWTDFHTTLAIARHGNVAKACVALGVTHSTLLRKLDVIESRLAARLFERIRGRYALTAAGHEIVQAAAAFESLALAAENRVRGQDLRPGGDVRTLRNAAAGRYDRSLHNHAGALPAGRALRVSLRSSHLGRAADILRQADG
jgi:DNA-binding transcriptional LysR family regulator